MERDGGGKGGGEEEGWRKRVIADARLGEEAGV